MIRRSHDEERVRELIRLYPITAIVGPRQCGKTTLARGLAADHFFDLEKPEDSVLFDAPERVLEPLRGLVVIDEVQRNPGLFPLLRYLVDRKESAKFIVSGSASPDLMRRTSESLAGRIGYHHLGGFRVSDVGVAQFRKLWMRGGFPRSFLAESDPASALWRSDFVGTFLERDLSAYGPNLPPRTMRRFWTMAASYHGQVINFSEMARSFGISDTTVRRYLELFEGTYMVRLLPPWHANVSKRLVRRPKLYVRDSGIFHALLSIENERQLVSNPKLGASWEGFALEEVIRVVGQAPEVFSFWATHGGAELDLLWPHAGKLWGVEIKFADAPRMTPSMRAALGDLELEHLWVVYPGEREYPLADRVSARPISSVVDRWDYGE